MLASLHVLQHLRIYIYLTFPDAGTLLNLLNIAMICVCMCVLCVLCVCVHMCVCYCVVQMCLVYKFDYLRICEHSNLYLPSFPLCVL